MADSKLPLGDMVELGKPYAIDGLEHAFAYRIANQQPGAVADPQHPGDYVIAFSAVCTHMGCLLVRGEDDYDVVGDGADHLTCGPCPCHGTTFDLLSAGLVVLGPATQNLAQLELRPDRDNVLVIGWRQNERQQVDPVEEEWPF